MLPASYYQTELVDVDARRDCPRAFYIICYAPATTQVVGDTRHQLNLITSSDIERIWVSRA